jgi:predicted O-methyltransferase YrrM
MIAETLHSGVDRLESAWLKIARRWYANRVAGKPGYVFTEHYAAQHTQYWLEYLSHLRDKPNVRFLEVGSFEGDSAIWFLENILTHPTATITCIDPFLRAGSEARFDHNVRVSACDSKLIKVKGRSESLMPAMEQGAYDAIYIDGNHDAVNVLMDAVAGWRLLKEGGIMIFDDYQWRPDRPPTARPQMAIDLFLGVMSSGLTLLHKDYQVIVRK